MPTNTAPRQTRTGIHVAATEVSNHDTSRPPGASNGAGGDAAQEQLVHARLAGDLRVEGDRQQVALAYGDRVPVHGGEHLHVVAVLLDPRGADEDGAHRALDAGQLEVLLERED